MPWNEVEEKQFALTRPIRDALDKKPPSVFTPFNETRWHKGVLTRLQVGDTEQTWLHVTNLAGKTFDVTKDMADTLPSADDWKELKRMHYRQNWESVDGGNHAKGNDMIIGGDTINGGETTNGDAKLDKDEGGGGSWFALKIEIPHHKSTLEYHKQVWAGNHTGAPFTKPDDTKAAKPDADDWAREFGRYPRKTIPDWAEPIVASASKDVRATGPLPFVHPFMTDWNYLKTAVYDIDLWAYITRRTWLKEVEKKLGAEWACTHYEPCYEPYYFRAKDDNDKGFYARAHEVLLCDYSHLTWSWAAERGEPNGPSRAILDYGYAHDILEFTRAKHTVPSEGGREAQRWATVFGASLSDFPLSYLPERETPVLLEVLTKDAAKDIVYRVPSTYVDVPVVAPTYEEVIDAFHAIFTGETRPEYRLDHKHLRQQIHYLCKRLGFECEDDGGETVTCSPARPPVDEYGYRRYDPDSASKPNMVFTFTKESIGFREEKRRGW